MSHVRSNSTARNLVMGCPLFSPDFRADGPGRQGRLSLGHVLTYGLCFMLRGVMGSAQLRPRASCHRVAAPTPQVPTHPRLPGPPGRGPRGGLLARGATRGAPRGRARRSRHSCNSGRSSSTGGRGGDRAGAQRRRGYLRRSWRGHGVLRHPDPHRAPQPAGTSRRRSATGPRAPAPASSRRRAPAPASRMGPGGGYSSLRSRTNSTSGSRATRGNSGDSVIIIITAAAWAELGRSHRSCRHG
jgi:hypothetical protein